MTKLVPIRIQGKSWIQLQQLGGDQAQKLKSWLPSNSLKNLTYEGILLKDCLPFDTYNYWYRSQEVRQEKQALLGF